jgi:hypothetical protein
MGGLGALAVVESTGWLATTPTLSLVLSLLTVENLKLGVLGFYALVVLGAFIQFFRYVILIPLLLRFGVLSREVLMTCEGCGAHHGVPVTKVAYRESSPCCDDHLSPPPDDCENGELYDEWGGERQ